MNESISIATRMLEVKKEIAQDCAQDSDFREAFLADPKAAVLEKYNLVEGALDEMKLKPVVEEQGEVIIVVGPDISNMTLTDDQLDQVAGGFAFTVATTLAVGGAALGTASASYAVGSTVNNVNKNNGGGW